MPCSRLGTCAGPRPESTRHAPAERLPTGRWWINRREDVDDAGAAFHLIVQTHRQVSCEDLAPERQLEVSER